VAIRPVKPQDSFAGWFQTFKCSIHRSIRKKAVKKNWALDGEGVRGIGEKATWLLASCRVEIPPPGGISRGDEDVVGVGALMAEVFAGDRTVYGWGTGVTRAGMRVTPYGQTVAVVTDSLVMCTMLWRKTSWPGGMNQRKRALEEETDPCFRSLGHGSDFKPQTPAEGGKAILGKPLLFRSLVWIPFWVAGFMGGIQRGGSVAAEQ